MSIWMILILAVLQGLTEFLPISSSGHLVVAEALLGIREQGTHEGIMFEICVHVGTLAAVLLTYRRKVASLVESLLSFLSTGFRIAEGASEDLLYIWYIIVASIPAAIVGLFLRDSLMAVFEAPRVTALLLVVTAGVLMVSRIRTPAKALTWRTALLIGLAQAVAILPGCSRSGWTITAGLLAGLGFSRAAEFSFIISIPAVLGALLLESISNPLTASRGDIAPLVVGIVTAFLAGWIALRFLLRILRSGAFHRFAYYLFVIGVSMFIFLSFRG
jgi:undecaprenyl-diphosphatase